MVQRAADYLILTSVSIFLQVAVGLLKLFRRETA
jgi:hypothetical protein